MKLALFFLLLGAPLAHAQTASTSPLDAGFAPSLWLGSTHLTAGDMTKIYTVVYDSSSGAITGDVVFSVDGATIGSSHFSLAAGASAIESTNWTATTGSHSIGAALANTSNAAGSATSVANQTITSVNVQVAAAPPPPAIVAAASAAANAVSQATEVAAPVATSIASNFVNAVESVRQGGADALSQALASSEDPAAPSSDQLAAVYSAGSSGGQVLGTSTQTVSTIVSKGSKTSTGSVSKSISNAPKIVASALSSISGTSFGRGTLKAALVVFDSAWIFYLILLLVLLALFWLLKRKLAPRES